MAQPAEAVQRAINARLLVIAPCRHRLHVQLERIPVQAKELAKHALLVRINSNRLIN
jgi:hypothetical protein